MKGTIILGSSRSDGNTAKIANQLVELNPDLKLIDLNVKQITYYDYAHGNIDDDFIPTIEDILKRDLIIFVTPVYWYSMSAIMKTFFDRLSDLLTVRKELGRQLRGKKMATISSNSDPQIDDRFYLPFRQTAGYLGMEYLGDLHTYVLNGSISESLKAEMRQFIEEL